VPGKRGKTAGRRSGGSQQAVFLVAMLANAILKHLRTCGLEWVIKNNVPWNSNDTAHFYGRRTSLEQSFSLCLKMISYIIKK